MSTQSELIFNRLLTSAFEQKASHLYLSVGTFPFIRKDGKLRQLVGEPIINKEFLKDLIKTILTPAEQEQLEHSKEFLAIREFARGQRFRLMICWERDVPLFSIKFISSQIVSLDQLKVKKSVQDLTNLDNGLVIISGPQDSGRSTIVLALLDWINRNQQKYIATLERPIESFLLGGKGIVEQREVGRDTPDFLTGLLSLKLRNVDVIFISEVNSPEMILALLEIAQSNALVFTVMNANTVLKVIRTIFDYFPKERQPLVASYLADACKSIICTKLVPRIGGGRVLAMEILNTTPIVQKALREQKLLQIENILQTGSEGENSINLDRYLADLVRNGQILKSEALRYANNPENLQALLREE
jgi:twitching motility protein PilT